MSLDMVTGISLAKHLAMEKAEKLGAKKAFNR
jgi:hypothetical protein